MINTSPIAPFRSTVTKKLAFALDEDKDIDARKTYT
jgi:hypothetical protein